MQLRELAIPNGLETTAFAFKKDYSHGWSVLGRAFDDWQVKASPHTPFRFCLTITESESQINQILHVNSTKPELGVTLNQRIEKKEHRIAGTGVPVISTTSPEDCSEEEGRSEMGASVSDLGGRKNRNDEVDEMRRAVSSRKSGS